jgi:REP element-mobilizing transposase RayT
MGRPLRIEYPNAFYHITSRGNERRAIFRSKEDYERFLGYFESATERYGARIHCFCLMPNHYHLLLETPRANLRRILHHLNTSYTNYFNAKTGRVGHLFQGRYRAILVEKDTYALELSRYIHLNPVRAHLVKEPSQYPWSSYLTYVEGERRWGWLDMKFILGQLSSNEREALSRYQTFVREGMVKSFEDPLRKVVASTLLGTERFVEGVRERFIKKATSHRDLPALRKLSSWPELSSIVRESERVFGKGTVESRRVALYLSHRLSGLSLGEIGEYFAGIGPSAVTQNTRRLEIILEQDKRFLAEVQNLKKLLSE